MYPFYLMFARSVKVVYKEIRRNLPIYMQGRARTSSIHFAQNKDTRVYQCANMLYKPCRWLFTRLIKSRFCTVFDP